MNFLSAPPVNAGQGFGPPVLDWGRLLGDQDNAQQGQQNQRQPPKPQRPPSGVIPDLFHSASALAQGAPLSSAGEYLPGGTAAGGKPLSINGGVYPAFSKGGRPRVGQPAVVGERGRELFLPDTVRKASTKRKIDREQLLHQLCLAKKHGLISEKALGKVASMLPGYQDGGDPPPGQPAIVGENGPEIFVPLRARLRRVLERPVGEQAEAIRSELTDSEGMLKTLTRDPDVQKAAYAGPAAGLGTGAADVLASVLLKPIAGLEDLEPFMAVKVPEFGHYVKAIRDWGRGIGR